MMFQVEMLVGYVYEIEADDALEAEALVEEAYSFGEMGDLDWHEITVVEEVPYAN